MHATRRGCFMPAWLYLKHLKNHFPPWGVVDAEIKVPSGENIELKRSPFKAWSMSVYSHTCYTYCQGFLPCLFLPFQSIHLHFLLNLSQYFLCWLWLTHGSCVGPQNKIGHPAEYKQAKNNMTCGMMTCEINNLEIEEVCVQPWCNPLWLTGLKAPTN